MPDTVSLRLQAAAGDARAQTELARMLLPAGRTGEAMGHLGAACAQNYAPALLLQAALATLGFARKRDVAEAIALLERAAAQGDLGARAQLAGLGHVRDPAWWLAAAPVEQIFTAPRLFTVKNFLPKSACTWLIKKSKNHLEPAMVRDLDSGGLVPDPARTCTGAGFSQLEADVVLQLACLRLAATLGVPIPNHETTNILRYSRGQEYRAHYDFISPKEEHAFAGELQRIGQRIATFLVYLNDDFVGGETEFPRLNWRFKGEAGDALIFWNLSAEGAREPDSVHAGRPVTKGEKWLFSKWVRAKPVPLT